jgi:hypothetical protein
MERNTRLLDIVAEVTDFDEYTRSDRLEKLCTPFLGDGDLLSWVLRRSETSINALIPQDRVYFTTSLLLCWGDALQKDTVGVLKAVWKDVALDSLVCQMTDQWGQCLVHAMAWNISTLVSYDRSGCVKVFDDGEEEADSRPPAPTIHKKTSLEYEAIIRTLVHGGSPLHNLGAKWKRCQHQGH